MEYVRGAVRPAVTVAFTATVIYGFVGGLIPADSFLAIAGAAILYWFNSRDSREPGAGR